MTIVNFSLAAIQRNVMIKIGRWTGHIRAVRADTSIVLKGLIFVICGCGPLLMIIQIDRSRRPLRVVMLMPATVN